VGNDNLCYPQNVRSFRRIFAFTTKSRDKILFTQENRRLSVPSRAPTWCLQLAKGGVKMGKKVIFLAMAFSALLAIAAETPAEKLPVRRVVLYKNGVGYFEHNGRVRGSQELKIDFTSAQLNDVLKSLTVLDLNGGKISGVGYNSVAPIA